MGLMVYDVDFNHQLDTSDFARSWSGSLAGIESKGFRIIRDGNNVQSTHDQTCGRIIRGSDDYCFLSAPGSVTRGHTSQRCDGSPKKVL